MEYSAKQKSDFNNVRASSVGFFLLRNYFLRLALAFQLYMIDPQLEPRKITCERVPYLFGRVHIVVAGLLGVPWCAPVGAVVLSGSACNLISFLFGGSLFGLQCFLLSLTTACGYLRFGAHVWMPSPGYFGSSSGIIPRWVWGRCPFLFYLHFPCHHPGVYEGLSFGDLLLGLRFFCYLREGCVSLSGGANLPLLFCICFPLVTCTGQR